MTPLQPLKGNGISWRSTEVEFREVVEEPEMLKLEGPVPPPEPEVVHLEWREEPGAAPPSLGPLSIERRPLTWLERIYWSFEMSFQGYPPGAPVRRLHEQPPLTWFAKAGLGLGAFSAAFTAVYLLFRALRP